ncbi:hypothetical protein [Rhizobium jaguaris]|uniref:Uncharacterized protein n=1 Tax=Rhizobium jaguaris TaxID=1312183 RepID=A0A387G283_9HYPH|nr:hypothetical protein [Rhizobium jaguaris]AYG62102.1 hypothetical protein CCGE525_24930 [Rhizobium jaguaris]
MLARHLSCLVVVASAFCCAAGAFAQEADVKPHVPLQKTIGVVTPTGPVPSLAVINSAGATLTSDKLTLTGVSANSIVFADRPVRAAGHVATEQFIMQWDEGKDNFAKNPPNATVSVLGGDGSKVADAVITLRSPKLDGNSLTFDVSVLEGSLDGVSGPAALFIDNFGGEYGGGGIGRSDYTGVASGGFGAGPTTEEGHDNRTTAWRSAHYWHAPVYHGAWYRSALPGVTGAAISAQEPYYADRYDNTCVDTPFAACY